MKTKKKKTKWAITFKDEDQRIPLCLFKNIKEGVYGRTEGQMIFRFPTKKSFNPPLTYHLPNNKNLYQIVVARGNNLVDFMEECPEFFF